MLTTGGVLSIVAGLFEIICGVFLGVLIKLGVLFFQYYLVPGVNFWGTNIGYLPQPPPVWPLLIRFILVILGILAIIGGVWAIRRKSFGVSLAGAICAVPSTILGILAVIFVCLGEREFKAKEMDTEVV